MFAPEYPIIRVFLVSTIRVLLLAKKTVLLRSLRRVDYPRRSWYGPLDVALAEEVRDEGGARPPPTQDHSLNPVLLHTRQGFANNLFSFVSSYYTRFSIIIIT